MQTCYQVTPTHDMVGKVGFEPTPSCFRRKRDRPSYATSRYGTPRRTRTDTQGILSPVPLPIGLLGHMVLPLGFEPRPSEGLSFRPLPVGIGEHGGAFGGTRTHKLAHLVLSQACLPVSSRRHLVPTTGLEPARLSAKVSQAFTYTYSVTWAI